MFLKSSSLVQLFFTIFSHFFLILFQNNLHLKEPLVPFLFNSNLAFFYLTGQNTWLFLKNIQRLHYTRSSNQTKGSRQPFLKIKYRNYHFCTTESWNRVCCHSNIKLYTVWCICLGVTSLASLKYLVQLLPEIFLILCFEP